jgi:hypothetical protein
MRGQMREIGNLGGNSAEANAQVANFLVAALKKPFQQAEFVHDFECGWVNSVAAKISEEIFMFFEDDDTDARSRQKIASHHAGGSSAGDATLRIQEFGRLRSLFHVWPLDISAYAEMTLF